MVKSQAIYVSTGGGILIWIVKQLNYRNHFFVEVLKKNPTSCLPELSLHPEPLQQSFAQLEFINLIPSPVARVAPIQKNPILIEPGILIVAATGSSLPLKKMHARTRKRQRTLVAGILVFIKPHYMYKYI